MGSKDSVHSTSHLRVPKREHELGTKFSVNRESRIVSFLILVYGSPMRGHQGPLLDVGQELLHLRAMACLHSMVDVAK